jgi:hypothetical protein
MSVLGLVACTGPVSAQCAVPNAITNGSFEFPAMPSTGFFATTPTGWTWTNAPGGFIFRGSPAAIWPLPAVGQQYVDIGNTNAYGLRQQFTVDGNRLLDLSWQESCAVGCVTSPYRLHLLRGDGSTRYTFQNDFVFTPGMWQTFSARIALEPGTYTLEFRANGVANGFDTLIDDVQVRLERQITYASLPWTYRVEADSSLLIDPIAYGQPLIEYFWQYESSPGTWTTLNDFAYSFGSVLNSSTGVLRLDFLARGARFTVRPLFINQCGQFVGPEFRVIVNRCDSIDFNRNGVFPEDQDILDFFNVLAGGVCEGCGDVDFNNNDVFPEDADILDFFYVLAGGFCE